eukprot:gene17745-biopygen12396
MGILIISERALDPEPMGRDLPRNPQARQGSFQRHRRDGALRGPVRGDLFPSAPPNQPNGWGGVRGARPGESGAAPQSSPPRGPSAVAAGGRCGLRGACLSMLCCGACLTALSAARAACTFGKAW